MTLDEAIKKCDDKELLSEEDAGLEHKVLGGWLRELKALREKNENSRYQYIVSVTYQHDTCTEDRRVYIGFDAEKAKQAFKDYHELWCWDNEDEVFPNPFKNKNSRGYCAAVPADSPDEITGKQAEKYLDIALDNAIKNHMCYMIEPEDVGTELDFDCSPCFLEVIDTKEEYNYG